MVISFDLYTWQSWSPRIVLPMLAHTSRTKALEKQFTLGYVEAGIFVSSEFHDWFLWSLRKLEEMELGCEEKLRFYICCHILCMNYFGNSWTLLSKSIFADDI